jgi:hypothetical protein
MFLPFLTLPLVLQEAKHGRHDHRAVVELHNASVRGLSDEDRDLFVAGPLDLRPQHRVHFDHVVIEAVVVEEGPGLAAERARLVLIQGQLQPSLVRRVPDLSGDLDKRN